MPAIDHASNAASCVDANEAFDHSMLYFNVSQPSSASDRDTTAFPSLSFIDSFDSRSALSSLVSGSRSSLQSTPELFTERLIPGHSMAPLQPGGSVFGAEIDGGELQLPASLSGANTSLITLPVDAEDPRGTTNVRYEEFCARFMESIGQEGIELRTFIFFMVARGHLDEGILRSYAVHRHNNRSSRQRDTSQRARKCGECGKEKTSQWRRHPETNICLCNACGQRAYRARIRVL
ncbi:hypothetical protein R3P38DRAFT_1121533 [Favolaschia claudopus]|uniref:GATA-type domain-containing protein n=1 Tax=Favolaschia claudopus TaxID=2862362 RepID=A0AAW0BAM7_9AGAR